MLCAAACRHLRWPILPAVLALACATGCNRQPQITRYQAPKEHDSPPLVAQVQDDVDGADRMAAAIVPHGQSAWFFKLAGPANAVGGHVEQFEQLVKSVTFAADGKPKWTLPDGWQKKSSDSAGDSASISAMRFATLTIGRNEPPLEVSITTLPWSPTDAQGQMLANVNRWRGQMSRAPLTAADLPNESRSLTLQDGEATLVDIRGTLSTGGMQPPFAKGAASRPAAPDSKAAAPQSQFMAQTEPAGDEPAPLPFTYEAPEGWTSSPPPTFAVMAFAAGQDSQKVEITATPLGAGGGGLLSNVNRWRGQLKLPPVSEDELAGLVKPYKVDGLFGHLVNLVGPEQSTPRLAIVVAVVERGDTTWFFRLRGDADLAEREMPNFEKFIGSIKFRGGEQ